MFDQEYNADICSSIPMPFSQKVDVSNLATFVDQNPRLEVNPCLFYAEKNQ